MKLLQMHPDRGYLSADLFIPKKYAHMPAIEGTLSFRIEDRDAEDGFYWLEQFEELRHHVRVPRYFIDPKNYHTLGYPIIDVRPPILGRAAFRSKISTEEMEIRKQIDAAAALRSAYHGTLNLACGRGKSVMAFYKIAVEQTPAIIIVPTLDLLEQWARGAKTFLEFDGDVGVIQGKTLDWKRPVVIAMLQTLALKEGWSEEFRRYFGLVFFDEGDLAGAPKFSRAAGLFYGDRYALTATAERGDGNEFLYQAHLGRIFFKDLSQELTPTTYFRRTGIDLPRSDDDGEPTREVLMELCDQLTISRAIRGRYPLEESDVHHAKLCQWLGTIRERNDDIVQQLRIARDKNRVVIVLSKSKNHLKILHEKYSAFEECGLLTGDTPKKQRPAQLRDYSVVFASMNLARRGLDRPRIDTLFLVSPFKSPADYQQSSGRALRPDDKKEGSKNHPIVVFWEDDMRQSRNAGYALRQHARSQGHRIEVLE